MKEFNIGDRVTTSLQSPSFPRREATVVAKEMRQFAGQLHPLYQVHFDGHATRADTWVTGTCLTTVPAQTKPATKAPRNPMDKAFLYHLGQTVTIDASGQEGTVIGAAAYQHAEDSYLVRYKDGAGNAVENWWTEGALVDPRPDW